MPRLLEARVAGACGETCNYASDNDCDDGGPGSEYSSCALGSDCMDCGPRSPSPSPPSPPSQPAPPPPPPARYLDLNGETATLTGGCQSTYIMSRSPDSTFGDTDGHWWDGSTPSFDFDAVLVQFTDLIGAGYNQLRPHDSVLLATLRYNIDTSFTQWATGASASLNEISVGWDSSTVTWNSFTGTAGLNGDEYHAANTQAASANVAGWHAVDVTASVNSWLSGVENHGWIFLPTGGGDGAALRGCNAPAAVRVNLQVTCALQPPAPPSPPSPPPPPPLPPSPPPSPPVLPYSTITLDGAAHAEDTRIRLGYPTSNYGSDSVVYWVGSSDTDRDFVLLKFELSSVPTDAYVALATLRWTTTSDEGNLAVMHELRVGWSESNATYANLPMPASYPFTAAQADAIYGPSVNDMPGSSGSHAVDVTPSITRWLGGTPNHGERALALLIFRILPALLILPYLYLPAHCRAHNPADHIVRTPLSRLDLRALLLQRLRHIRVPVHLPTQPRVTPRHAALATESAHAALAAACTACATTLTAFAAAAAGSAAAGSAGSTATALATLILGGVRQSAPNNDRGAQHPVFGRMRPDGKRSPELPQYSIHVERPGLRQLLPWRHLRARNARSIRRATDLASSLGPRAASCDRRQS